MKTFSLGVALFTAATLLLLFSVNEISDLEVTHHTIGQPGGGGVGLRVAQISDLHLLGQAEVENKALQELRRADPDLVVLTGDILTHRDRSRELETFLRQLPSRAEKIAIPGNWEYWAGLDLKTLRQLYARHRVTLLINEALLVDRRLLVVGLDDFIQGEPDLRKAMTWHMDWRGPVLILAHNPMTRQLFPPHDAGKSQRVILSGHTHGGQIALGGFSFKPVGGADASCMSGWCQEMYVSRGIGTSIIPLRLGARPELSFFEWFLQ
ncbi:MAG: metallophosphoesterase [Magnetococcales bacterium]|nr:metallophosphoesterase [Magnetococcales bacterium]